MKLKSLLAILADADGWLLGGAVDFHASGEGPAPKDYDVMVPIATWHQVAPVLAALDIQPNRLGGWKIALEGTSVDVWPDRLARLIVRPKFSVALHLGSGVQVRR